MIVDPLNELFAKGAQLDVSRYGICVRIDFREPCQAGKFVPLRSQKLEIDRLQIRMSRARVVTIALPWGLLLVCCARIGHGAVLTQGPCRAARILPRQFRMDSESCWHLQPFELSIERLIVVDAEQPSRLSFDPIGLFHRPLQVMPVN